MSASTTLEDSFCTDLITNKVFNEAEMLVRDTYKLQVEAKQSEKKFVITANGIELLELAVDLLKSWLERKKKRKGDSIDDRIKDTKENSLLDISEGHVVWLFWGELGSKLLSEKWQKDVEKLKYKKSASVTIQREPKEKRLCVTCNFECFEAVRKKVENLIKLVTSGISGLLSLDKSQKSESNDGYKGKGKSGIDGSKGKDQTVSEKSKKSGSSQIHIGSDVSNGSGQTYSEMTTSRDTGQIDPATSSSGDKGTKDTKTGELKATEDKGTCRWRMVLYKSETPATEAEGTNANTSRQLKGASGEHKLPSHLGGNENGLTQMPHGSASKDERSEKDKHRLFCTENGRIKVYAYEASIVNLSGIDAIVNAANGHLGHAGGVAYHISKAAGGDKSALEIECRNYIKKNKKVYVTKNFTSSAGNMPYEGVIHAVGPVWTEYKAKDGCAKDLCMTIINVLIEADKKKFSKIAVPAISSGIHGVPKRLCAEMYIRGVIGYDRQNPKTCVREIHFVDVAKDILQEISNAYERWKQNDNNINFKNANSYSSGTPSTYRLVQEASGSDHELSSDFVEGSEWKANDGTPLRYRLVQEASGSDHELSSDFVEGSDWKANDGRNCVLLLLVKYRMVQGEKIVKAVKSIPCTWNFLAYWNFYTKTKQGKKLLDDIVKKYGCSVTVSTADEDLFIFEVTGTNFRQESDMLHFVNGVLNNIYEGAKQSLCCEFCSVSHRIQESTLKRVKEEKELQSAWIQLVGEHDPDAIYVVCAVKDKLSVLNVLTEVVSEAMECYNNHEETVAVDFIWQRVLKVFKYLQELTDKFPNIMIKPDEKKHAVVLKGARDELKAATIHLQELIRIAHSEVHENIFSPACQFEILTYPEMCDYVDIFMPKVPILWIPNTLSKKIHIFSKQPEQAKGAEKLIKGCVQERMYISPKYPSLIHPWVRSLEKLKQKHNGKIVIQASDAGFLVTTADDIFESVDAEIHDIISNKIDDPEEDSPKPKSGL